MDLIITQNYKDGTMEIAEQGEPHPKYATGFKDIQAAGDWERAHGGGLGAIRQGRWKRYRLAWVPGRLSVSRDEEA